jgi:hypothetical protein
MYKTSVRERGPCLSLFVQHPFAVVAKWPPLIFSYSTWSKSAPSRLPAPVIPVQVDRMEIAFQASRAAMNTVDRRRMHNQVPVYSIISIFSSMI